MRRVLTALLVGAATVSPLAQGAPPRFQHERGIDVTVAGPQRLDVDVTLLQGSQPFSVTTVGDRFIATGGMNDLRLFSQDGQEVPYLLVPPSTNTGVIVMGRALPITATDLPNEKASGFEIDLEAVTMVDAIDLATGIRVPFLKRFRLEGSGDRTRWTQLVSEGTAFNLPAEGLAHTRIEFAPGEYRYLRVTWDDTNSARLPMPAGLIGRGVARSMPGPIIESPVAITERPSEPGRSRFRLTLPAARLPIVALKLKVGGGHLSRDASVLEASLVGEQAQPATIGRAKLVRVVHEGVAADALRIPIRQPSEAQLDLVVDNGDNPPLALEAVTAVFAELPMIYFEAAPAPIVARWGDARLAAPRYDLEAVRNTLRNTPPSLIGRASWRSEPARTLVVEPEALPMPEVGAALAIDGFEHMRDIPPGRAGLVTVPLDAAVMAHSGVAPRRLTDLRIVDGSSRQVPYLVEKRDEPLAIDIAIERRDLPAGLTPPAGRITSYAVSWAFPKLPEARLVVTTQARVFRRTISLNRVEPAAERRPERLAEHDRATWVHADELTAAPAVSFALPESVDGAWFLIVEEGDNQPLPIAKATVLMPSYALRLFRPADASLRMIYGKDGVPSPRYDLQLLAPHVMGRVAEEIAIGPEERFAAATEPANVETLPPMLFWAVLGIAVLVLLAMVVKLMRREAV